MRDGSVQFITEGICFIYKQVFDIEFDLKGLGLSFMER